MTEKEPERTYFVPTPETVPEGLTPNETKLFLLLRDGRDYSSDRLRLQLGHDVYTTPQSMSLTLDGLRKKLRAIGLDVVTIKKPKEPRVCYRTVYRMVTLFREPTLCEEDPGWGIVTPDGCSRHKPYFSRRTRSGTAS